MSDYTPTTEDMREVFVAAVRLSFKDVGASAYSIIRGVTHGGAWFDSWLAEEIRKAKAEGARTERERIASLAESSRQAHDIAECAAYVEGENGRQEAIDRWLYLCEEPDVWLRGLADDPEWLDGCLFEAWEHGAFDAHSH